MPFMYVDASLGPLNWIERVQHEFKTARRDSLRRWAKICRCSPSALSEAMNGKPTVIRADVWERCAFNMGFRMVKGKDVICRPSEEGDLIWIPMVRRSLLELIEHGCPVHRIHGAIGANHDVIEAFRAGSDLVRAWVVERAAKACGFGLVPPGCKKAI